MESRPTEHVPDHDPEREPHVEDEQPGEEPEAPLGPADKPVPPADVDETGYKPQAGL